MKKINVRPSWDEYFLQLSDLVSTRATCQRLKVGAVLVKDKKIISTGYCGAPKKLPDCFEAGCYMVDNHCIRTIHAEANAVVQAAFHTFVVNEDGNRNVPYLNQNGKRWNLNWNWLDNDLNQNGRLAVSSNWQRKM